ncbi:hypothetical protein [Montanilutibacter psychrotolerans]|uniref:Uncharacterized protein n=1 Tax=Montanilutibacter psychrotolerans TaxID=1327343 RepID=A0A3M8T633_9GAMM|nr:hypothetical protein [Lysobacter psychrotolerans]RNF86222.1 hypothetical protein EER27_02025 [Lysobacter psychrotolerans]
MSIFNLLSYKLENFLNIRPFPKELGTVFYEEDEPSLLSVVARKHDGATVYLSRWQDLFSKRAFEDSMSKVGFTEPDCYAILLVLSRFGHLLEIDNRQRANKDYFIFFYLIQLISLKNSPLDADARLRNHMIRFLLFELSIDDEAYRRFSIKDNQLTMATDTLGPVAFLDVIDLAYKVIEFNDRREHELPSTLKNYQTSVVKLLTEPDGTIHRFRLNDRHSELMYPDVFLQAYDQNNKQIFDALIDAVNPLQSTENLFVSNVVLMNYSFHVLKNKPREILKLRRYISDEALFGKLLEAIITRRMGVNKALFEKVPTGQDLSLIKDDQTSFYNILYSL